MNTRRIVWPVVALAIAAGLLFAWEDGRIAPHKLLPRHATLLFGPDGATRVLLRIHGDAVALDLDGDGRFDSPNERFDHHRSCTNVVIRASQPDDRRFVITSVRPMEPSDGEHSCLVNTKIEDGTTSYEQYADVNLSLNPRPNSVAHFDGPLQVQAQTISWKLPPNLALVRGEKPTDVRVLIGTLDLSRKCWTVVRTHQGAKQSAFPTNVFPVVEVEFPPLTASAKPVTERFPLSLFC